MEIKKPKCYFLTLLSIVGLYAAHTSPLYFATFAMPTILRAEGSSLALIGLLGMLMLPWAFKFLWAPWLDRFYSARWGKRKSWIIPTQIIIVGMLMILLLVNPVENTSLLFLVLFGLSLFAATQDIASGAYVIEQLSPDQHRWGNYAQVIGTTLGSACGGALILFCYGYLGWRASIICILALAILFFVGLLASKERQHAPFVQRELPSLRNFWDRPNTRYLLYMCLIYRGCEGLVMGMQQPFLVDQHISVDTIGLVMGIGNLTLGLVAAGVAGILLKPLGGWRMLILLGCLRSFAYLSLFGIALFHIQIPYLIFTVVIINMATRLMEMVTLYTIFMKQCSSHQAATDFSILVCGELIIYMIGMSLSGYLAQSLGYSGLFLLGSLLSFPSVIISTQILRKMPGTPALQYQ